MLVACEFSGRVRDAFTARGWDAWSCDLLPSETPGQHIQGDAREAVLSQRWDLLVAHPPCTYLCSSGMHWTTRGLRARSLTDDALEFVRFLLGADVPRIALENPVGVISTQVRKPDCIVHPWQFGHAESKTTCLWLKGLPVLRPTNILEKRRRWENQTQSGRDKTAPGPERWKKRSRTYTGIAAAMAEQWGNLKEAA